MPRMTMAQALVKFLDNQYVSFDGEETKFVDGIFTIFGHGIVVGLGQAMDACPGSLKLYQGKNEQGMAHAAMAYAKMNNRRKIIACSSSIGPGSANMITAAATATVNNVPLLLLPADTFASRQPDPVLQQFEQPHSLSITTTDAYRPVVRYWDRIVRPEMLMSAMINAMRVLTNPATAGAVCIALPQDVEGESYDYPDEFFRKRIHLIPRRPASDEEVDSVADVIASSKKPFVICGGGVRYSEAGKTLVDFCEKFNIPYGETQAGKSATKSSERLNMGGFGVTGNSSGNEICQAADCVIGVGTRFSDFTTSSKSYFTNAKITTINVSDFDAYKLGAVHAVGDAKATLEKLEKALEKLNYKSKWTDEYDKAKAGWKKELSRLENYRYDDNFEPLIKAREKRTIPEFAELYGTDLTQTSALIYIMKHIAPDAIAVGSAGSLPGDMQRIWETDCLYSYNMEYGYSCMGYEIAGALGSKMAHPDREVYSFCGDGSFLMLHSELVTSIQEGMKINVCLFDNAGFGCINNLEMSNGVGNLGTEFRKRDSDGKLLGNLVKIDFAKCAEGYGLKTYSVRNLKELADALADSKKQTVSTLIDLKVLPKTMTDGYDSWWHTGLSSVPANEQQKKAYENMTEKLDKARKY